MRNKKVKLLAKLIFACILVTLSHHSYAQTILDNWEAHKQLEKTSPIAGIQWISLGPDFMGSRIETIEIPHNNPAVIYAGFGSGGLWKTENQGLSWRNIFKNQPSFSIGDLAISYQNSDILWLGTGEQLRASRGYSYPGSGVYVSKDGGNTWTNKGLTDSHHIGRIVIDPYDQSRVFVAAMGHFWSKNKERGLFYTDDGGENWENILYISDSVGINDVIWDANNKILYACSWQIPDGEKSRIYRSYDLGKNWEILPFQMSEGSKFGRIGLGFSASWPENIYAIIDNRNASSDNKQIGAEVYRSGDYGDTWKKTHSDPLINYGGFGWAFGDIIPHPVKPNELFILGIHLMRSQDGGKTFHRVAGKINHIKANPATSLHLDQHDLKIIPGFQDTWILGNDGGLYISIDEGENWIHTNTIPTGEFHDIFTSGRNPVMIYGGTQDNSNLYGTINPYNYFSPSINWDYIWLDPWSGGDGFTCFPDASDPDWVYWESQNGHLNKKNLNTLESKYIKPKPDQDERPLRNSWFTPFIPSHHNHKTIYYGANKVYKSTNSGDTWIRNSHDLTYSKFEDKKSRSITRLAESPLKPGIIYAATEKGAVWVSRNDGTKWFEISLGIPTKKIVGLFASQHEISRIYLVAKGMDNDDQQAYVFVSDNFGSKWKNISSNLPLIPVNCINEDPEFENILYVGTDVGVYCSRTAGKDWEPISSNLPTSSIHQLKWMSDNQFLLAASHGQGLFYSDIRPIRIFAKSGFIEEPQFLSSIDGGLPQQKDYNNDWNFESLQPAVITWFSPDNLDTEIDIYHESGDLIYSTQLLSQKGINIFTWDLIIDKESDSTNYPLPKIKFPKAGNYDIQILLGAKSLNGNFLIK